ncbi:MAG: transcription-repair coupling factor [Spirochaetales bacterium]|nr:transcription-repair coupling factor [Spirochaetales bacterium]
MKTGTRGQVYQLPVGAEACFLSRQIGSEGEGALLLIAPDAVRVLELEREFHFFAPDLSLAILPGRGIIPYEPIRMDSFVAAQRMQAFSRLTSGNLDILLVTPEAWLGRIPDPTRWPGLDLSVGNFYARDALLSSLVELGYSRVDLVETVGQFSVKGSVLDLFAAQVEQPLRLDFLDDELESIHTFDLESQRRRQERTSVAIGPVQEFVLKEKERLRFRKECLSRGWPADNEALSTFLPLGFPLITKALTLPDLPGIKGFCVVEWERTRERFAALLTEIQALHERSATGLPPARLFFSEALDWLEDKADRFSALTGSPSGFQPATAFNGRIPQVRAALAELVGQGARIVVTSPHEAQQKRIASFLQTEGNPVHFLSQYRELNDHPDAALYVALAFQKQGFSFPEEQLYFWTDNEIFGRSARTARFKSEFSSALSSFIDLKENDFVVHIKHGVGKFLRLERVTADQKERDFLVLEYAGGDILYVPLDQISLVQRYVAPVQEPRLDSLGKASFQKVRERVARRVEELAGTLIEIYAARMARKGYAYPADSPFQMEFEADFAFEETPDQITAIAAIKGDMESERPMDRLVCGDVGYGKTEVAMRAMFKAVMAGKQVVFIAPTTILVLQHFRTMLERFKNFPVTIEQISRFKTAGEIRAVRQGLKEGQVDIVVGTHALLNRYVRYKNLGLLIIDEEQRFGVAHKEEIKRLKNTVDVLTLSATPIPRTLHMSLVGIRDLSIIQTPPRNRLPIQTHVVEDRDELIRDAILHEMDRQGQVFFLHNRIDSLPLVEARLQALLPQARLAVLHGQLSEETIEDTILDFMEKRYDVLITTTIIESGIDMPAVNTLIVDQAHTFGLAQLYQIRGRVGRSDRQAHAYMLIPPDRSLTEVAQKRLSTIQEYQELGSGFKVAMRDLEIRGAGNIIGQEQSGDIMEVGFELYVKLLEEAVKRQQGQNIVEEVRCAINLKTDFYLPEDYIRDTRQRIEFYKRFEAAQNEEEVDAVYAAMVDRFGAADERAMTFVRLERIRALAGQAGFASVYQETSGHIRLKSGTSFRVAAERLISALQTFSDLKLKPGMRDTLFFQSEDLDTFIMMLRYLCQ